MRRSTVGPNTACLYGLIGLYVAGCGGSTDPFDEAPIATMSTTDIIIPTTTAQADQIALDIDGDGAPDNRVGQATAILSYWVDFEDAPRYVLEQGYLTIDHLLFARDLEADEEAGWEVHATASGAPYIYGRFQGSLEGSGFSGSRDRWSLSIPLPNDASMTLEVVAVKLEAQMTERGCIVRLGGALPYTQLREVVYPEIVRILNEMVGEGSATARLILDLLDDPSREADVGTITVDEIADHQLISAFLAPDLDLMNESGQVTSQGDGEEDSLSLAVELECTTTEV